MWRNVLGEGKRSGHDVFVEQVDVVAFGVGWVVVKRQIPGEHGILQMAFSASSVEHKGETLTRMTPQLQTSTFRPV